MNHFSYKVIPSAKEFQKDSSVTLARRAEDRILSHLDWLLQRYEVHTRKGDATLRRIILCEIFLAANYWIKSHHEKRPNMKKERYPAVLALFEAAVGQLCMLLGCTRPMVAIQIEEIFGRDLTPEGAKTDGKAKPELFTEQQLALYRIRFKCGRAYHPGFGASSPMRLALLNTAPFFSPVERMDTDGEMAPPHPGWGPFVMTMEREFYMTRHWLFEEGHRKVFHSSYTHGRTICAAGTMHAEHGIITAIRPDSGHYKPLEHNFVAALLALQMFGVPMDKLEVQNFKGKRIGTARDFVQSRLTWAQFQEAANAHRLQRVLAAVPGPDADGASGNTSLLALLDPPKTASMPAGPQPGYAPSQLR